MARPKKYTVDYFPHDAKASRGRTLSILYNHFGHDGISAWWQLLEIVSDTENHVIDIGNPENYEFLASTMRFPPEKLKPILNKMAELGAINTDLFHDGKIWIDKFIDRISTVYKIRKQELPTKPELSTTETRLSTTETELLCPENPQTKVNYSKLNYSKVDKKKVVKKNYAPSVSLTEHEFNKLVEQFGAPGAMDKMENLSLYKRSKGKRYNSDYDTILSWDRKDKRQANAGKIDTTNRSKFTIGKYGHMVEQ